MNYLKFSVIIFPFMLLISCQEGEEMITDELETELTIDFRSPPGLIPGGPLSIFYSKTELVVQYDPSFTEDDKEAIRNQMQVLSYEVCAHCDETIEKWDFGPGADIEHKYATAKEKEAEAEGLFMVDREFEFNAEDEIYTLDGGSELVDYTSKIVSINTGVSIAVLDSGVDANYSTFDGAFLYKNEGDIAEIQSGWDYVEENDNCYDDNPLVHGTAVATIIHSHLDNNTIPHQILPIKVADASGKVSLFNAICGLSYVGPKVEIVQMSFGWYDSGEDEGAFTNDIFSSLIEKYEDQVLFVTSAGNSGYDNDIYDHYPSNYSGVNIISVAAANAAMDDMADFSNYGATSVDFISLGTDVIFQNMDLETVLISGTSFSAPQVAAIAARELYLSGMTLTPSEVVSSLDILGTPVVFSKPTIYNKILLP